MTLSSPKGFEIGQPTRDIRRVWKLPLGLNNPVFDDRRNDACNLLGRTADDGWWTNESRGDVAISGR